MKSISVILIILLAGCYTQKKAERDTSKALERYPEVVAKIARDSFPCINTGADTTYITDDSMWLYVTSRLLDDLWSSQIVQDSLLTELENDSGCLKYV